jgi:hypothetical protein
LVPLSFRRIIPRGDRVRDIAAASSLELALLSSYRVSRKHDDGLLLRFGALEIASLQAGIAALVAEIGAAQD